MTNTYTERVEGTLRDLQGLERKLENLESQIADEVRQLTKVERDLQHPEREIEKLRLGRYEYGNLLLAAVLGGGIAFGSGLLLESIKAARTERQVQTTKP